MNAMERMIVGMVGVRAIRTDQKVRRSGRFLVNVSGAGWYVVIIANHDRSLLLLSERLRARFGELPRGNRVPGWDE